MRVLFWVAVGLLVHTYLVYPLCVVAIGRLARRSSPPAPAPGVELPPVAVVIAAWNEERHIDGRIRNLLALDYPPDRLTIYVGSDGSTDRTTALAEAHASSRVRVFAFDDRRGKASVLNDLLASAREPIVVFTDANTEFHPDAVARLVRHFADPSVGAVCGELRLHTATGGHQERRYWRFETALKLGESRIGVVLGASGALYAIRRDLYRALPADTMVDDFTIAMHVAALGRRTVFEPLALAFEDAPPGIDTEFYRRIRIGIGNYQVFFRGARYWMRLGWMSRFAYLSHKVLRWFSPHLLIVALLASLALAFREAFWALLFDLQVLGYAVLVAGMWLRRYIRLPSFASAAVFVFAINVAFLVAFWLYVTGRFSAQWSPRGGRATVPRRWSRAG